MPQIVVNAVMKEQILALMRTAEVVDENGKLLGRFIPVFDPTEYEIIGGGISDEELQRREQPGRKRYTTEQVLEHLRKLP